MFSGDEREFARIVRAHHGHVSKLIRQHPVLQSQHDDLIQEIFLSLYLQLLKQQIRNMPAYLTTMTKRRVSKVTCSGSRRVIDDVELEPSITATDVHHSHECVGAGLDLEKLTRDLSDVEHHIFDRAHEGFSHKEIAEEVGITEESSRKILSKLRRRLRHRFADYRPRRGADTDGGHAHG